MAEVILPSESQFLEAANNYAQFSSFQQSVDHKLVKVSNVKRGEKVLDLGCGTGYLALVLSELVGPEGKIVAVDLDKERVRIASETFVRPNIEYQVGSDKTFLGDGYDLLFSSQVIHCIKDKHALFERVYKKLRPGGRIAFLTPNGTHDYPVNIIDILCEFAGEDFYHTLMYDQEMCEEASIYRQLAETAGFQVTMKLKVAVKNGVL